MSAGKKILFVSNGSSGNIFPFIPVAIELRKQNVDTVFMVNGSLTKLLRDHNFTNIELPTEQLRRNNLMTELVCSADVSRQEKLLLEIANLKFEEKFKILNEKISDYDLIVLGGRDRAAVMSVFTSGREFILLSFNPYKQERIGMRLSSSFIGRFCIRLLIGFEKKGWLGSMLKTGLLRSKVDIKPISRVFESSIGNAIITGAVHKSLMNQNSLPEGFDEFIRQNRDRKILTIAFGSYSDILPGTLLKILIDTGLEYGCGVILVSKTKQEAHKNLFQFTNFADLDLIFRNSDVIVHHCGHGTIVKAILSGKPSISIPLFGVQYKFAEKLHSEGLSPAPLDKLKINSINFTEALNSVFENRTVYERNINEKKQIIEKEDGIKEISEIILKELYAK